MSDAIKRTASCLDEEDQIRTIKAKTCLREQVEGQQLVRAEQNLPSYSIYYDRPWEQRQAQKLGLRCLHKG